MSAFHIFHIILVKHKNQEELVRYEQYYVFEESISKALEHVSYVADATDAIVLFWKCLDGDSTVITPNTLMITTAPLWEHECFGEDYHLSENYSMLKRVA